MKGSFWRLLAASSAVSGWLVLLLAGHTLGGFLHLLLVAGGLLVPWRELFGGGAAASSLDS